MLLKLLRNRKKLANFTTLDIAQSCNRIFQSTDGELVLNWLVQQSFGQSLPPEGTNELLRQLEGKRQLVKLILDKIEQGK